MGPCPEGAVAELSISLISEVFTGAVHSSSWLSVGLASEGDSRSALSGTGGPVGASGSGSSQVGLLSGEGSD